MNYRLETAGPGKTVTLAILSRGRKIALDIKLERAPESVPANETHISGENPLDGANVANISPRLLNRMNVRYRGDGGVILTDIDRGSTAMRIGFRRGDILVKINGVDIRTVADVTGTIEQGGRTWSFEINRNGRLIRQFFRG